MLIFLHGKEDFLIKQRLGELKDTFTSKYPNASLDIFDFEEGAEYSQVEESFHQGGGLFASQKMIVLLQVSDLLVTYQEKLATLFKQYAGGEDVVTVCVQKNLKDKKAKHIKYLEKHAEVQKFDKLKGVALRKWIEEEVAKRSKKRLKIHPAASDRLAALAKGVLWQIDTELEKLTNYRPEGMVTIEDVNLLCQGESETKIFDLVDAISQRNKAKANDLIFHLLNAGENEFYIFTMIIFQFRNLVRVADCQKKGIFAPQAISKSLGIHPYVATKSVNQLRNFPMQQLKMIYELAARLDREVKIGDRTMQEALTYFVARV